MLYLKNTTEAQALFVPRNGCLESGKMQLTIKSTMGAGEIRLDTRDVRMSDLYYNISVSLPEDMADGEHTYTLEKDGMVLSTGLVIIGIEPFEDNNNIIEYESE